MNRSILAVGALAGALALGACGTATAPQAGTAAASSAAPAAAQPSAAVGDVMALKDLAERSSAAIRAKRTVQVAQTVGDAATSTGQIDYAESGPRLAMTTNASGRQVDVVYTDGVMYLGGDSLSTLSGGKKWVKLDPDGTDLMSKMMAPVLTQMESSMSNPADQLKVFADVDATVSAVEDGATTYTIKLTQEQLAASVKAATKGLPGGLSDAAVARLADGLTYTMTVDAGYLPSEMVVDVPNGPVTVTYSKWGEPVTITAPAADEVGTFSG